MPSEPGNLVCGLFLIAVSISRLIISGSRISWFFFFCFVIMFCYRSVPFLKVFFPPDFSASFVKYACTIFAVNNYCKTIELTLLKMSFRLDLSNSVKCRITAWLLFHFLYIAFNSIITSQFYHFDFWISPYFKTLFLNLYGFVYLFIPPRCFLRSFHRIWCTTYIL